jgi:Fic family protein
MAESKNDNITNPLLKDGQIDLTSNVYREFKNDFTYHSSKIEGSTLSSEENLGLITKSILKEELFKFHERKFVLENSHLIDVFDYVMQHYSDPLDEAYIKNLHKMLCYDSPDLKKRGEQAGEYRQHDVRVGNHVGARPFTINDCMRKLMELNKTPMDLNGIARFHCEFETIHPFYDGNGRVGRMIMLKQCLDNNVTLFYVNDLDKKFYYNALEYYQVTNTERAMVRYLQQQQEIFKGKYIKEKDKQLER